MINNNLFLGTFTRFKCPSCETRQFDEGICDTCKSMPPVHETEMSESLRQYRIFSQTRPRESVHPMEEINRCMCMKINCPYCKGPTHGHFLDQYTMCGNCVSFSGKTLEELDTRAIKPPVSYLKKMYDKFMSWM